MKHAFTRALAAVALIALTAPACASSAGTGYAAPDEIQRSVEAYVGKTAGVVVIAGVIDHGATHIYTAGSPPAGAPPLNADTIFQIGSVSKTFTAALLADLVVRGRVHLGDPVAKCLPSLHVPTYQSKPITLLNLAEQNSGLPRLPANLDLSNVNDPYASYTEADLQHFLSGYTLTRAPGSQYEYSNLGVSLLGIALAGCMHMPFSSLLNAEVLAPLGMRDTGFDLASRSRLMPGFDENLKPAPPWTGAFLAPAGGLYSTMRDMLRYLRANLEAPKGTLGEALAMTQEPRAPMDGPPYLKIGLIWAINVVNGNVTHNGQTGGYHAIIFFNRAQQSGVVILTNVADMNADNLAYHIVAPALFPAPAFAAQNAARATSGGTSPYAGVYQLSPSFSITVSGDDKALYAQGTGQQPLALTLVSGETFAVEGVDAQITFVRDHTGRVAGLILHQNGMDQRGQRQP